MAINRQDSRHRIKRSTLTGVVPTVPVSSDFTDGTWLNTDIRAGEFFYNIPDEKLWIGTNTVPLELTSSIGNTLADVLANGNTSGTNNIIMGTNTLIGSANGGAAISLDTSGLANNIFIATDGIGMEAYIEMTPSTFSINNSTGSIALTSAYYISMVSDVEMTSGKSIKSMSGGGQIDLDYFSSPGEISISTDNGNQSESYLYMTPTSTDVVGGNGGSISLNGDVNINVPSSNRLFARVGDTGVKIDGRYNAGGSEDIFRFINNATLSFTTQNSIKPSVSIASQNSTINAGVTNSVILGGVGINATYSNSVYVPDLYIQSSKAIKSSNGGQLDLDFSSTANSVVLSNDNGLISKSYLYLLDNTALLAVPNSSIYLDNNGIVLETVSSSSVNINTRIFKAASTANATAATSTLASISMSNDQTLTIQVVLNAYCASPNRNLGITMMASFLKYGGTIYQTGTTSLITKDGFGDGSTGTIDTDGTNVRIRITNGAGLTTNWNASYDYLLTT